MPLTAGCDFQLLLQRGRQKERERGRERAEEDDEAAVWVLGAAHEKSKKKKLFHSPG